MDDPNSDADAGPASVFARSSASRLTLHHTSGRWGTLALAALHHEPLRFNALRRRIDGISEKMLSKTLHALERDGFVTREVQETMPPRVEYALTPLGTTIAVPLLDLIERIEASVDQVTAAQEAYDAQH